MIVNRILKVVLLILAIIFIGLQAFAYDMEGTAVGAIMLLLLTVLYYKWTKKRSIYFFWFLVIFTVAQFLSYVAYYASIIPENKIDYYYYIANLLFIMSYIILIIRILKQLDLKKVLFELPIPILILVVLDVFCVTIVSGTTEHLLSVYENTLEYIYNAVVMILLSVALINYMHRNDNKSMLFVIASICIVFSEIIQLAYYYILDDNNLSFIYSFFLMVAFLFLYLQSQLQFTGPEPEYSEEPLEI